MVDYLTTWLYGPACKFEYEMKITNKHTAQPKTLEWPITNFKWLKHVIMATSIKLLLIKFYVCLGKKKNQNKKLGVHEKVVFVVVKML